MYQDTPSGRLESPPSSSLTESLPCGVEVHVKLGIGKEESEERVDVDGERLTDHLLALLLPLPLLEGRGGGLARPSRHRFGIDWKEIIIWMNVF